LPPRGLDAPDGSPLSRDWNVGLSDAPALFLPCGLAPGVIGFLLGGGFAFHHAVLCLGENRVGRGRNRERNQQRGNEHTSHGHRTSLRHARRRRANAPPFNTIDRSSCCRHVHG
jgi:hypothetical protein